MHTPPVTQVPESAARSDVLVDPQWLAARLHDPAVRVVEVDVSRAAYDQWHIDQAVLWNVYADLRDADYRPVDDAVDLGDSLGDGYFDALGIQLLKGRKFSPLFPADTINTIILNETAVKALNLKDPIGQQLIWDEGGPDTTLYASVIGVADHVSIPGET